MTDHSQPDAGHQPTTHEEVSARAGEALAVPDQTALLRRAVLLAQVAAAGAEAQPFGKLNKQLGATVRRELGLSAREANRIRQELAGHGFLNEQRSGRNMSYALTDTGRAYLATLEQPQFGPRPCQAGPVDETAIPEELREAQKAYVLLQLLDAADRTLTQGEANRIPPGLAIQLGLKPAVASHRRARLAEQGYLRIVREGRTTRYVLTPDGLDYLAAAARHLGHARFAVTGRTLNTLLDAARESPFEHGRPGPEATERQAPATAELTAAVLAEFEELRRERFARSGLVPIHEVRRRLAERFGPAAARHDVLDQAILDLWRQRRIGLEVISDLTGATAQQLDDSIPGVNETLFYLEAAREQPVSS